MLFLQMLLASRSVLKSVQIADFIKKYVYKVKKLTVNFCFKLFFVYVCVIPFRETAFWETQRDIKRYIIKTLHKCWVMSVNLKEEYYEETFQISRTIAGHFRFK